MVTIKLRGQEIPLIYTMQEMKSIQEEIGPAERAIEMMNGINPEDNKDQSKIAGAEQIDTLATMIRIMGNAGLEEAGKEANLTNKMILRALKPVELWDAVGICMEAIEKGMASEIPEKEEDGPIDITLEEIRKKNEKAK